MSIEIVKPAIVSSLVAAPREGYRSWGIGSGGAMDTFAYEMANALVGNEQAAVIELGYSSSEIYFHDHQLISATGKGFTLFANEKPFPMWRPVGVEAGSILKLVKTRGGAWSYLAVHGGWKAEEWLGSFTTHLTAKAGGFRGRLLQKSDRIELNTLLQFQKDKIFHWSISSQQVAEVYNPTYTLRCMPSAETELLLPECAKDFCRMEMMVTPQSNRMGYRLQCDRPLLAQPFNMVSSPVDVGTIQLLPDGNLIVLMADCQTTGGYPRIASVIAADLPKLAQVMPGEKISFNMVSLQEAEWEWIKYKKRLAELKRSCHLQIKNFLS
ncbi:MAG: biotin-dependent carboxyltransferase [Bacteroidetes bacterium]|nr:biotin-dependent carboxyltransferase [Bacteroidota bacterium]MBS1539379.1 biotin-dependent carboxyltransferase [Bacteroidota bacterium]